MEEQKESILEKLKNNVIVYTICLYYEQSV